MTSPIKPPGGGPFGSSAPEGAAGARGPAAREGTKEAFRETLERTQQPDASPEVAAADPLQAVREDLRAGRIDGSQAIERLVQHTLETGAAAGLPPAARAELESHLRRALADDPSLSSLTKDLERGTD